MAINLKDIIADGLLSLCAEKKLQDITIKDILHKTGVSRQSFYNHFMDKNDLIQYIYLHRIITDFDEDTVEIDFDFQGNLLKTFHQMKKYKVFLKQALLMDGQNCLKDYLYGHCQIFDLKWHQKRYGSTPMPDNLRFATEYHATASTSMTISWILSDMPVSCEEMAELITSMRSVGMEKLFENGETKGDPYKKHV